MSSEKKAHAPPTASPEVESEVTSEAVPEKLALEETEEKSEEKLEKTPEEPVKDEPMTETKTEEGQNDEKPAEAPADPPQEEEPVQSEATQKPQDPKDDPTETPKVKEKEKAKEEERDQDQNKDEGKDENEDKNTDIDVENDADNDADDNDDKDHVKEKEGGQIKEEEKDLGTPPAPEMDEEVSKADDSVGDAPNEEGEKTDDAMDTEDQTTNRTDVAEEASTSSKTELPYSTRGRSTGNEAGSGGESWDRGALDSLEEIGRAKEHTAPAPLGASFLEALSEEERRTRTRFLPDVDGMHILRKGEIKDDIALARSLVSASGVTSLKKSKAKRSRSDEEAMDVDEEEAASPSEDDRSSENTRGTAVIEFRARDLVVPSNSFVAPNGVGPVAKDDEREEHEDRSNTLGAVKALLQSPSVVDSVIAFNPPRPPESIGAKKKHRMLRWERRPEDVEVDLNNYRKTVQRTRQELHSAETEYTRLETIDAHLRWHYLGHLNLMNEEFMRLNEEFSAVQQECVKAADLLTSRTRSRGAGKGSYVMRDVLTVLKSRGAEAQDKDAMDVDPSRVALGVPGTAGVGGLPPLAFDDWKRSTTITPMSPASSWIVPGEKVTTPYGDGIITEIHPALNFQEFSAPNKTNEKSGDDEKSSDSASGKDSDASKGSKRKKDKSEFKGEKNKQPPAAVASVLPTRVSAKLAYGTGHFSLDAITATENPAALSDAKLANRWKSMIDSALSVSGCLDIQGMSSIVPKAAREKTESDSSDIDEGSQGRSEDPQEESEMVDSNDSTPFGVGGKKEERVLPFGSGMLPTSSGRGAVLQDLSITDIEKAMNDALFSGRGVLGETTYQGVTEDFRKWEDDETEYLTLQASVLQRRNALVRQKRIRMLNERTNAATTDRYHRAEELVSEMRADLKSLKQRLEQELQELGIDESTGEQILSSFYRYHADEDDEEEEEDAMEITSPKRTRDEDGVIEEGFADSRYGEDADRDSTDEAGTDELSGDDLESHRASKKLRPSQ
mmetsp:Transcript_87103/g.130623  ORF Transcript_87103/g.130623 Transcript_87103/m.130623 type:complete len:1013 (+) Transcript_87103:200-3238(+)|eukprot:CAMPEP_0117047262 /NCGR_PEP_ID=MMETSP0472-20121206/32666_1 /TAXON_ID=693140 ORGANISM="Tiarina fusus, Strain LIS" /NCGR_SAMPLE_ID=MMETSP0472 /ASSEMBLY_ACC=CAM_ASM_000603 /LENGTH=1012 /DNA_ID=CAMNT_0004759903 /DNA_START=199 /DNA_END=3237 /DNA_ORIENTATION=+